MTKERVTLSKLSRTVFLFLSVLTCCLIVLGSTRHLLISYHDKRELLNVNLILLINSFAIDNNNDTIVPH